MKNIITVSEENFQKIYNAEDKWAVFCDLFLYDERFPTLLGGLDHIEQTKNQIVFHDIGVNNKENSFTIRN